MSTDGAPGRPPSPAAPSPGSDGGPPQGRVGLDVLVVGAGLIGCSIALALSGHRRVALHDTDRDRLDEAVRTSDAEAWDGSTRARLAVVAVPPSRTGAVAADLLRRDLAETVTHVAGVQSHPQREVETTAGAAVARYCGGHPMAGAASSGPGAARADLFAGRVWAVCPGAASSPEAVAAVEGLARDCGAEPVRLPPDDHDAAVALVSHLPQLVSSALAAVVADAPGGTQLAGPGLADTTRLAASPAELWLDVLGLNGAAAVPLVRAVAGRLVEAADALEPAGREPDLAALAGLLEAGRRGRARIPLKRGSSDPGSEVRVVLDDRPGQLVAALEVAARAGVNVEDLRLDHLRGRPRGVLALAVAADDAEPLRVALSTSGFVASSGQGPRK